MTQRERTMATVLGGGILFGLGFFGFILFYNAYSNGLTAIAKLDEEVKKKEAEIFAVRKDAPLLTKYLKLSLGSDLTEARFKYKEEYLNVKLRQHGLTTGLQFPSSPADTKSAVIHPTKPNKQPIYMALNFNVEFKAKMANLMSFIRDFQSDPKLHRIKSMVIERTADKKDDGEWLQVRMNIEALSVLDAQALLKNKLPAVLDKRSLVWDTVAFITKGPTGLPTLGWSVGPNSPRVDALNPPLTAVRDYNDVARRNIFLSWRDSLTKDKQPQNTFPTPDDVINNMRFNRLIRLTESEGISEGGLWDMSTNKSERLKTAGGFNKWTLVKSEKNETILWGQVVKIEDFEIVFKVILRAKTPSSVKWWRYPESNNFFTLHSEDLSFLMNNSVATELDKGRLFLVHTKHWDELTAKETGQIELTKDGKTFYLVGDKSAGEIVYSDNSVVIVRLSGGWPANSPGPQPPSVSAVQLYPEPTSIYTVQKKHFEDMLTDNKLVTDKLLKASNIDRVYVMHTKYWDDLVRQKVLHTTTEGSKKIFFFYSETMCGEVISLGSKLVVFRIWDDYCHCKGDSDIGIEDRWHDGLCVLRLGGVVQDALMEPVSASRQKELHKLLGLPGGGD